MKRIVVTKNNQQQVVTEAVRVLQAGGLILFPTETTYGAGVDACNPAAVEKLLAYKTRREGKPLSIAVTDLKMAQHYVEVNDQAAALYQQFLPGPLTVVSKGLGVVAPGVESEFGTLGVRIPDYPLVLEIVKALGRPMTATSANGSGEKRPYSIEDVLTRISGKQLSLIDLIVDAGELPVRPPSTVIDTTLSTPLTLREGTITVTPASSDQQTTELYSQNEAETKRIAGQLLLQHWDSLKTSPIVIGLDGPLGAGKTIFTKGAATFLQIKDVITSPTYSYVDEYDFQRHQTSGKLFHFDMWKIDSEEEFSQLKINELLQKGNVLVIEWWSQVATFTKPLLVATNATFIHCSIGQTKQHGLERKLEISSTL